MLRDRQGLEMSIDDPESVAAVNTFFSSFLSYGTTAGVIWEAAARTPGQVLVDSLSAALEIFMQTGESHARAQPYLSRAAAGLHQALPRERLWYESVRAWVDDDLPKAAAAAEEIIRQWPEDLAAMKLGQLYMFHIGDHPGMLRIAEAARAPNARNPYWHGMLAFALEENNRLSEAEAAARHAVALQEREPWAHHALAHVMEAQGRAAEGLRWMQGLAHTWEGCNSFMLTHNWWHTALFALDLDDPEAALDLYDRRVWSVWKEYSQDQVNAISLLARLELAGPVNAGERWQDLAGYLVHRLHDHVDPFLDLHYLLGLTRAGRDASVSELLTSMGEFSRTRTGSSALTWREAAMPLARGIAAFGREQWGEAFRQLGLGLPRSGLIGGSHAQRDLFCWLWLEAGFQAGEYTTIRPSLCDRAAARPGIARHRRELARID